MSQNPFSRLCRVAVAFAASCLIFTYSCDDDVTGMHDQCKNTPIASSLSRVFYWGDDGSSSWVANQGRIEGSGTFVQWITPSGIVFATETVVNGVSVQGIAELHVDSADSVLATNVYDFVPKIWDLRAGNAPQDLLVLFFQNGSSDAPTLGRLRLELSSAVVDSVILDESWNPRGVAPCPFDSSLIVCAKKPGDELKGIYRLKEVNGSVTDSLLFDCEITDIGARSMDVAANRKLYFVSHQAGAGGRIAKTQIICFDLASPGSLPLVVAERSGEVDRIAVDPTNSSRLLLHRSVQNDLGIVSQNVIEIFDVTTSTFTGLNVRTSRAECRVTRNHFPDWKPDGSAIVFPGWSSDGKTEFPSSIWRLNM